MDSFFPWCFDGGRFLRNVQICVENGRITNVLPNNESHASTLPRLAVPGLINLHTHLELTDLQGCLPRQATFPRWVDTLRRHTRDWTPGHYLRSTLRGAKIALSSGTTTLLDVGNSGANWEVLKSTPLRLLAMRELLGLQGSPQDKLRVAESLLTEAWIPGNPAQGLCAHSLYSCLPDLIHETAKWTQDRRLPFTLHLEESQAEHDLFRLGRGPMRRWLDRIAPNHPFQGKGPGGWLRALEAGIPDRSIVVHGNLLEETELAELRNHDMTLVHCPQSAAWFGHPPLDVAACLRQGVRLCLGTDSLASAESLSLWDQSRLFHQNHPELPAEDLLSRVTSVPGEALDPQGALGTLRSGSFADLVTLALPEGFDGSDWNWLWQGDVRVLEVWIGGKLEWRIDNED
ncbi:MAG TPA: amidohydrolase family protein [Fibrobacteraceae bacterium]|nr:amidohydrolase family protein [Fibrobacteraceae bacterium]